MSFNITPVASGYQEIHPYSAMNIDSVKINTSLIMMKECMVFVMVLHGILLFYMVLHRLHGVVQLIWRAGELPRSASSHFVQLIDLLLLLGLNCNQFNRFSAEFVGGLAVTTLSPLQGSISWLFLTMFSYSSWGVKSDTANYVLIKVLKNGII